MRETKNKINFIMLTISFENLQQPTEKDVVGKIAGSFTNAPSATETTHSRLVVNHNSLSCNFQL
jgi:hypothetical protein